jgi:hypothetical protein
MFYMIWYIKYFLLFLLASAVSHAALNTEISTTEILDLTNTADSNGYGNVGYKYYISTYEVTRGEYAIYLNQAGKNTMLYSSVSEIEVTGSQGSYTYTAIGKDRPITRVSLMQAMRYANWLTNIKTDAASTNINTGMYDTNAGGFTTNNSSARNQTAFDNGGVALANLNEWYKAAYHVKGTTNTYTDYATNSNSIATADALYNFGNGGETKDVDAYNKASSHGTYGQNGNANEWVDENRPDNPQGMVMGGGVSTPESELKRGFLGEFVTTNATGRNGIRLVSKETILMPEPSTYALIFGGLALVICITRRRLNRR